MHPGIGSWAYLLCKHSMYDLGEQLGNGPWSLTCGREPGPSVLWLSWPKVVTSPQPVLVLLWVLVQGPGIGSC